MVKMVAAHQTVLALSSGEADFYAIVKGSSVAMGLQSVLADLGVNVKIRVFTDATTGRSLCQRKGLGKVRHIATSELWIQEVVKSGRVELVKIKDFF